MLTNDIIRQLAPSAFATHASPIVSANYTFLPTTQVIDRLAKAGWDVVQATQKKAKAPWRVGFQKHLLRFEPAGCALDSDRPNLLVLNSHESGCSYIVRAGYFRFACANGIITGDDLIAPVRIRHTHVNLEAVLGATSVIAAQFGKLVEAIDSFKDRLLTQDEMELFARAARSLRWQKEGVGVPPLQLLACRRSADAGCSLWSVYNRVQEHLLTGGQAYRLPTGRWAGSRAVRSIDDNVRINAALWKAAEDLRDARLAPPEA
jgi:hypothetical protein